MFICSRDENKQTQEKLGIVGPFDKVGYFYQQTSIVWGYSLFRMYVSPYVFINYEKITKTWSRQLTS